MTKQIAVKLPDELVDEVDRLVAEGELASRSQAVREGLAAVVATRRRTEIERRYQDAAARRPETDAELREATRLAVDAIREEPWAPWW